MVSRCAAQLGWEGQIGAFGRKKEMKTFGAVVIMYTRFVSFTPLK